MSISRPRWVLVVVLVVGGCNTAESTDRTPDAPNSATVASDARGGETLLDSVVHLASESLPVPEAPRLDVGPLEGRRVAIGDGVGLYVIESGEGPPLVLLNGGPGNTLHSFLPHFESAAAFSRVIYYDQRGTGRSDWTPGADGYSTARAVDDLEALRRALGIDRWFVLGHSFGGLLAQHYAERHPDRLLGLILVGSSVSAEGLDPGGREYRLPEEIERIREVYAIDGQRVVPVHSDRVDLPTLAQMIYNGYVNGDWKRQYFYKPSDERMAQIARYEWVHDRDFNARVTSDGFDADFARTFRDSPLPTLVVEGAFDANWGPDKPQALADLFGNARLVVLPRAAHYPFAEDPEAFFGVLRSFVTTAASRP